MDKNYCIFGDSVTNASYIEHSWVNLLRIYLQQKYKDQYINVYNLGVDGHTTNDILARLEIEARHRLSQYIMFAIGINDSAINPDGENITDEKRFCKNLQLLISKSKKKFTSNIIFIGLVLGENVNDIPIYGLNMARKYDNLINQIAIKNDIKYIKLIDHLDKSDFSDGLHPNEKGHQKMFEAIKNYF